jgi:beta-barrel assembly-enhancing protease
MSPTLTLVRAGRRLGASIMVLALGLQPVSHLSAQSRASAVTLPQLGDPDAQDLSPLAERRLGEVTMREIRRDPAFMADAELEDYLVGLISRLTAATSARRIQVQPFWVRDPSLNAFAMPGGFVGVHSGLALSAQSESELAAVLGHEIGHVVQRHLARMLAKDKQSTLLTLAGLVLAGLAARAGNIEGAVGLANLGSSIGLQQQLAFSRDAEREADRLGLDIVREAGFNPLAMVEFFQRLQQAGRVYESGAAPAYLRTHPLTTERIGDVQVRLLSERYRQIRNSLEFDLVRARLRVDQDMSSEGLSSALDWFNRAQQEQRIAPAVAHFGRAHVHAARRNWVQALSSVQLASQSLPAGKHPYLERLESVVLVAKGDAGKGLALIRAATQQWPQSRALAHQLARAAVAAQQAPVAIEFLRDRLSLASDDPEAWKLLGDAYESVGKKSASHQAYAQSLALQQLWQAAVAQLQSAQNARDADFMLASVIDTQLREYRVKLDDEKRDRNEKGR